MREFYMVWVAGTRAPSRVYTDLQAALDEAQRLRTEVTGREVYVMAPTHRLDGRPLTGIKEGSSARSQPVEPKPDRPSVTVKKSRKIALAQALASNAG
jgi:hypothetical protein